MRCRRLFWLAAFGVSGCGSVPASTTDASADATNDAPSRLDAQSDATSAAACGDAGYFITVNGDGVARTFSYDSELLPDASVPAAYYLPTCSRLFVIAGSEKPDGGALLYFQIDSSFSPGPSLPDGTATLVYIRADGTWFASKPSNGQPTFTKLDAPGGVVAGTYALTVSDVDASTQLSLSGAFCTSRLPDDGITPCPP